MKRLSAISLLLLLAASMLFAGGRKEKANSNGNTISIVGTEMTIQGCFETYTKGSNIYWRLKDTEILSP